MHHYYRNHYSLSHDFGLGNFLGTVGGLIVIGLGAMIWFTVFFAVSVTKRLFRSATR